MFLMNKRTKIQNSGFFPQKFHLNFSEYKSCYPSCLETTGNSFLHFVLHQMKFFIMPTTPHYFILKLLVLRETGTKQTTTNRTLFFCPYTS